MSVFDVVDKRSHDNTSKPPDVFRFDTTRIWARLRPMPGLERPQAAEQVLFEIQVPTMFQYAWSVVTRDFVYKTDQIDWKRDRLVAQLKAAVEQIELIIAGFDTTAAAVPVSGHDETDAKRQFLLAMRSLADDGLIPATLFPESWSRLADNTWALVKSYAGLRKAAEALIELTGDIVDQVRRGMEVPHSGSLFQVIAGVVHQGGGVVATRHLNKYPMVPSSELRDLHGIAAVPTPITFGFDVS